MSQETTKETEATLDKPQEQSAPEPKKAERKFTFMEWVELKVSKLSTRNNFWHRVCSWLWLPFAFRSGIRLNHHDKSVTAVLPFRRFNRNWYNAMAGAVLLGNSEIAGGSYVFKACNGRVRVVCKRLEYRFLRPCVGPALYRCTPREDIDVLVATEKEFNITLDIDIYQAMRTPGEREMRVGRCTAVFYAVPITADKKPRKLNMRRFNNKKKQS